MTWSALPTTSSTNFDFDSLHVLQPEINVVLKDAEVHLREFYDDPDQASLLLDSANNLAQLAKVFYLIGFDGAGILAQHLSNAYATLSQGVSDEEDNEPLMTDISEAIMVMDRYVEFVLLHELLEPTLLLPVINKLRGYLGQDALSPETLREHCSSITIYNPAANYASPATLDINIAMVQQYRRGLGVILTQKTNTSLSDSDRQKIEGLSNVCATLADRTDVLFWQAAAVMTRGIADELPLNHAKKRILIYIEQQFYDYLPVEDKRFAQLVQFAYNKDSDFAAQAHQKYTLNQIDESTLGVMKSILFGPNREIANTLNELIQKDLETIKQQVDNFVRADGRVLEGENNISNQDIAKEIVALSKTLYLLKLTDASSALQQAGQDVWAWEKPTLEELDALLDKLMIAENAAISLAKSHTPGAGRIRLHNQNISLRQLESAYEILVKEARNNLLSISDTLSNYLAGNKNTDELQETPYMIRQVSGATAFLHMNVLTRQLVKLANKLEQDLLNKINTLTQEQLVPVMHAWADILVAVDMELENIAENRPASKRAILTSEHSLNTLLVA